MVTKKNLVACVVAAGFLLAAGLRAEDKAAATALSTTAEKKAPAAKKVTAAKATFQSAKALLDAQKWEEALAAYEAIGESKKSETWRCNNMGLCYMALKKFDKAVEVLDAAVKADPENMKAWGNLRAAAEMGGDVETAVKAYRKCLETDIAARKKEGSKEEAKEDAKAEDKDDAKGGK